MSEARRDRIAEPCAFATAARAVSGQRGLPEQGFCVYDARRPCYQLRARARSASKYTAFTGASEANAEPVRPRLPQIIRSSTRMVSLLTSPIVARTIRRLPRFARTNRKFATTAQRWAPTSRIVMTPARGASSNARSTCTARSRRSPLANWARIRFVDSAEKHASDS